MEKRQAVRVPISMNIDAPDSSEFLGFGYARDISEKGLKIDAEALFEPVRLPFVGSELRMRFKLPRGRLVITAIGKVIRVEPETLPPFFAIEFVDLIPEFRLEIRQYVEQAQIVPA